VCTSQPSWAVEDVVIGRELSTLKISPLWSASQIVERQRGVWQAGAEAVAHRSVARIARETRTRELPDVVGITESMPTAMRAGSMPMFA